jgi:hypothetical protein
MFLLGGLLGLGNAGNTQESTMSGITDVRLDHAPLVVELKPEPTHTLATCGGEDNVRVLAIEGIEGTTTQPIRINVFLNKGDAGTGTSTGDSSFVGFIQLLPVRAAIRRVGHAFELSQAADLDLTKPIQVTLVPVAGEDSVPNNVALRIGRIYLRCAR